MSTSPISRQAERMFQVNAHLFAFFDGITRSGRLQRPDLCNFVFGNPNEMPLSGFVNALQRWSVPQNKDWFAYKMNEPESQRVVAESLRQSHGLPFEPDDIYLTTGAFGALAVCLDAVVDPGDEVIFPTPPWFFYEMLIVHAGGVPVRVPVDGATFDLDLDAIRGAITERTRAIIINSPNNPTGKIYPPETLIALAQILTEASERNGRTIYLLSDEAYRRILYEGHTYYSPTAYYLNTFLIYTYGKTLLTPGQRIGYIALPPTMPDRETVRGGIFMTQLAFGHAFPNALLQHALPDLEKLSIDIAALERRRDRLTSILREAGYDVHTPEGTFYLLPRSPWQDDVAFVNLLAEHDILCLPGTMVEMPGYFRISLTANDEMVERSIPGFRAAMEQAKSAQHD